MTIHERIDRACNDLRRAGYHDVSIAEDTARIATNLDELKDTYFKRSEAKETRARIVCRAAVLADREGVKQKARRSIERAIGHLLA